MARWVPRKAALTEARWISKICVKLELVSTVGLEMSLWLCMVSPCYSFHSCSFAEFCQCIETSRAAECSGQGAGQEEGRARRNSRQIPCDDFNVFSWNQAIHYSWVNTGPRLTLAAFVLCCLALILQAMQHKESIASNKATLDLVRFVSSRFMP